MTHSYVSHSSSICTTCRADTTIRHDFFEFGKWFIVRATRTQCLAIAYFKTPPLPRDVTCWRYTWHDAFIRVTWLIHMQQDSLVCVTWLIYMCGMTHSYVWHDPFICVTWLISQSDMTRWYVTWLLCLLHYSFICDVTWFLCLRHGSFIRDVSLLSATWLIHTCGMPHTCVWHDSFISVTWLVHTWRDSFVCDMAHSYATATWLTHMQQRHDSFVCNTS